MNIVNYGPSLISRNVFGTVTVVTSGGTTTLTSSSTGCIQVVGTNASHTIILPVIATLVIGQKYEIYNNSSAVITVKDSSGTAVNTIRRGIRSYATVATTTLWVFDMSSIIPERLFSTTPGNYTTNCTVSAANLYNGVTTLTNTISVYMPAATTLYADLTTILNSAPPPGFGFKATLFSISGTQTLSAGTGCTIYGSTTSGIISNTAINLWVQVISPTAYFVCNTKSTTL